MRTKYNMVQRLYVFFFDKVDEYVRTYDSTKHLELFYSDEKSERIFDRISYLIMLKSNISEVHSLKYTKIKILKNKKKKQKKQKKTLNMQKRIILIKSVFNKNHTNSLLLRKRF